MEKLRSIGLPACGWGFRHFLIAVFVIYDQFFLSPNPIKSRTCNSIPLLDSVPSRVQEGTP
jgi:hypothetical protein